LSIALFCLTTIPLSVFGAEPVTADLGDYRADSGVKVEQREQRLHLSWPMAEAEHGSLVLDLAADKPLIAELGFRSAGAPAIALLKDVQPATWLTVGSRDLSQQGWSVFFDNPPRRPHETHLAKLEKKSARVASRGKSTTVSLGSLTAGPFRGELYFTIFPGCRLVHVEAVLTTDQDARAILYDAGIASPAAQWESLAWINTSDELVRVASSDDAAAQPVAVRHRAIVAECERGSVAVFPPPHQYIYPLDFSDNFKFAWHGRGFHGTGSDWGFGVRQPPEGDRRFVPWINAPPGTQQRLGVFYLLSAGDAKTSLDEVRRYTHGDQFVKLPGHRTFTSHYHVEHTLDYLG
jgi:hypothetical protein